MARNKKTDKKPIEQYDHKGKKRVNNPPVGLVTPETDPDTDSRGILQNARYAYDPHLDPQLQWAGKAEHTAFEVPTVSLHVHERIDPRTIIEAVRKKNGGKYLQRSLFAAPEENPPLREAIEFYKHKHNWSNRLIAGDSLLVMNSLLEKEGLAGQVQMIYLDPPYGIRYGSNFQPFVNKRDVKDGRDEDLTAEPEMIKAFRDTWELGIHSYLTYLRDRLLLARELLTDSGSCFVQISDENVHHVRELMDAVFGVGNFCCTITYQKTGWKASKLLSLTADYILWYAKDSTNVKFRQIWFDKLDSSAVVGQDIWVEMPDKTRRRATASEIFDPMTLPRGSRLFRHTSLTSGGYSENTTKDFMFEGRRFHPGMTQHWKCTMDGLENTRKQGRLIALGSTLRFVNYLDDFPVSPFTTIWTDTVTSGFADPKVYVVQTGPKAIQRCLLMTTDPGDLVFDPTCGSGTTAYVAEQWGRRWITCDTSRVAVTLAKQRLMTALFDYYELAHYQEGVGSGFKYKTVPHITLKSIANNEPSAQETLYDQPFVDNKKVRVNGPFTVEAVPAPMVKPIDEAGARCNVPLQDTDNSIARSGETLRQSEWRSELLRTGIRGKKGQYILFSRVEPLPGTRWLHADAETKPNDRGSDSVREPQNPYGDPIRAVISFGPEHAPLEQRQVELAWEEARTLFPRPKLLIFAAFQFDPEAAKDIDGTDPAKAGMTFLKVQMNADLLTDDLKKKRASNESFWLIGQPDVAVKSGEWLVDSNNQLVGDYEQIKIISGVDSLAEINRINKKDLCLFAVLSQRRELWADFTDAKGSSFDSLQYSRGSGTQLHGRISSVPGHVQGIFSRIGDLVAAVKRIEFSKGGKLSDFVSRLRGDKQVAEWLNQISLHQPLITRHYTQVEVLGFDYYNTKTGTIDSGGTEKIALWMLDPDYDGRSLLPRQVFFPMAGEKEGWSRLARNLKAEIDDELIEAYRGTVSLPFEAGDHKRVAIKIVDDRGIESLKILEVE
jgi:Adenine specific DNA methylase Mod